MKGSIFEDITLFYMFNPFTSNAKDWMHIEI